MRPVITLIYRSFSIGLCLLLLLGGYSTTRASAPSTSYIGVTNADGLAYCKYLYPGNDFTRMGTMDYGPRKGQYGTMYRHVVFDFGSYRCGIQSWFYNRANGWWPRDINGSGDIRWQSNVNVTNLCQWKYGRNARALMMSYGWVCVK
jgi:hypothetical protein